MCARADAQVDRYGCLLMIDSKTSRIVEDDRETRLFVRDRRVHDEDAPELLSEDVACFCADHDPSELCLLVVTGRVSRWRGLDQPATAFCTPLSLGEGAL